jgi:hypothetical protein
MAKLPKRHVKLVSFIGGDFTTHAAENIGETECACLAVELKPCR